MGHWVICLQFDIEFTPITSSQSLKRILVESVKTTSIEVVSTKVLGKNNHYLRNQNNVKQIII